MTSVKKNKPNTYKTIPVVHGYFLKTQRTTLITAATHNPCLSTAKSVLSEGAVHRNSIKATANEPANITANTSLYQAENVSLA